MDTYFQDSKEIEKWIDMLIEKLLTVSLLSGDEADSEFHEGRQAAKKIVSFLKQIPQLPEDKIMDGVQQLVEQRLPDHRVIENIPAFYQLMNEMIKTGLQGQEASTLSNRSGSDELPLSIPCSIVSLTGGSQLRVQNSENNNNNKNYVTLNKYRWNEESKVNFVNKRYENDESRANIKNSVFEDEEVLVSKEFKADDSLELSEELKEMSEEVKANEKYKKDEDKILDKEVIDEREVEEGTNKKVEDFDHGIDADPKESGLEEEGGQETKNVTDEVNEIIEEDVVAVEEVETKEEPKEEPKEEAVEQLNPNKEVAVSIVNLRGQGTKSSFSPTVKITPDAKNSYSRLTRSSRIPTDGGRLARVLKDLFPKSSVKWNMTIGTYTFYAQVDKLLIFVIDNGEPSQEFDISDIKRDLKKQGWYVYACTKEDLAFPRRLERGIKLTIPKRRS